MTNTNAIVTLSEVQTGQLTEAVAAYLSNHTVALSEIGSVTNAIRTALFGQPEAPAPVAPTPAVSVKKSVTPEYIICLEDGKKLKMLKRHLRTAYNMSPDEYRAKWNLPADYPMVAPAYAEQRSQLAKDIGLGQKKAETPKKAARASKKTDAAAADTKAA